MPTSSSITLPPNLMTVILSRNWRIQPKASINVSALAIASSNEVAFPQLGPEPGPKSGCRKTADCSAPIATMSTSRPPEVALGRPLPSGTSQGSWQDSGSLAAHVESAARRNASRPAQRTAGGCPTSPGGSRGGHASGGWPTCPRVPCPVVPQFPSVLSGDRLDEQTHWQSFWPPARGPG